MLISLIISICIYALITYYGKEKGLVILVSYNIIRYLFNVTVDAINTVNYESTIIGMIVTYGLYVYRNYFHKIRKAVYYLYTLPRGVLNFFIPLLPEVLVNILWLKEYTLATLLGFIFNFIYNVTTDLISLYCK
ncbi:putative integral membrane protein (apicoplast) [Theileria parva strain Muguga]|uniref:Uncharacterized protein n=1 Tax=Theileria parva TaxID=5875 RepID=Q4MYA3_THEPA|nr:putative integral membrane protein [Theileria parva strain Muguga]|eukprot:XP_762689.1 hypothetical protein (apicoplast) [Theileria parva strain Muguga]